MKSLPSCRKARRTNFIKLNQWKSWSWAAIRPDPWVSMLLLRALPVLRKREFYQAWGATLDPVDWLLFTALMINADGPRRQRDTFNKSSHPLSSLMVSLFKWTADLTVATSGWAWLLTARRRIKIYKGRASAVYGRRVKMSGSSRLKRVRSNKNYTGAHPNDSHMI